MDKSNSFMEKFFLKPYKSGSLDGLIFSVKDCIDVKSFKTGFGNPSWLKNASKATQNALCIEQLLLHGATCIGKTITDELTYSLIGENQFYGTPLNPIYPDRVPGGSSSGSASSVAYGLCDFSIGTDTGGSIRVPASNCGLYGYRPSYGMISTAGVLALAPSLDTVGILSKSYVHLRSVFKMLTGVNRSTKNSNFSVYLATDALSVSSFEIQTSILKFLDENSIKFKPILLSKIINHDNPINKLFNLYRIIHSCELLRTHGTWLNTANPELGKIVEYNIENIAKKIDIFSLNEAVAQRAEIRNKINEFLHSGSLLIIPTTPDLPPQKGEYFKNPSNRDKSLYSGNLIGLNALSSLAGLPQITIPIKNGVNIYGMSFITAQSHDELIYDFLDNWVLTK